jgi:hypothetical protein
MRRWRSRVNHDWSVHTNVYWELYSSPMVDSSKLQHFAPKLPPTNSPSEALSPDVVGRGHRDLHGQLQEVERKFHSTARTMVLFNCLSSPSASSLFMVQRQLHTLNVA